MPHINKILKGLNGRYIFLIVLAFLVIIVLVLRLAQLQLSQDATYVDAMRKQSIRPIRIPAVRGRIESSDGQILVDNQVSYDLMFYLREFKLKSAGSLTRTSEYMYSVLRQLARILDMKNDLSEREILNELVNESTKKIKLVESLTAAQKKKLAGHNLPSFIVRNKNEIILDFERIDLLDKMSAFNRTAESICREIDRVSSLIGRPMEDHRKQIERHLKQKPALPYKALQDLNPKELAIISEMLPPLEGTDIQPNARRHYPYPEIYSHLLGYTRLRYLKQEDKKEKSDFFYYLHSLYGVNGLEAKMDDTLKGTAGRYVVQVNTTGFVQEYKSGKHSVLKENELEKFNYDPVNGNNVILTLDHEAQQLAYDLLNNIPQANLGMPLKEGESIRSAFVLMDCETGAVKALVSTPSYDLAKYRETEYYKKINNPEKNVPEKLKQQPLVNRALSAYEPGSIIKPLLSLALLEHAHIDPEEELNCEGKYLLPTGKPIGEPGKWGHGPVTMAGAIEQSCNTYFISHGVEMGVKKMQQLYKHAGLGRFPMALNNSKDRLNWEKSGLIPGLSPWYLADTAYSSIGQGRISVSPLQAAVFVAAIANGGKVLKPQLIEEIRDSQSNKIIEKMKFPIIADYLPVKPENIEIVQQGMRRVVVGEHAGAPKAQAKIEGAIELAGKTGSAEVEYSEVDEEGKVILGADGKRVSKFFKNTWFTAFGPYEKPKYVAVCFVQGGYYGGTTCAPVVRQFFDNWSVTKPGNPSEKKKAE